MLKVTSLDRFADVLSGRLHYTRLHTSLLLIVQPIGWIIQYSGYKNRMNLKAAMIDIRIESSGVAGRGEGRGSRGLDPP